MANISWLTLSNAPYCLPGNKNFFFFFPVTHRATMPWLTPITFTSNIGLHSGTQNLRGFIPNLDIWNAYTTGDSNLWAPYLVFPEYSRLSDFELLPHFGGSYLGKQCRLRMQCPKQHLQ
jgi:hypothetical protein